MMAMLNHWSNFILLQPAQRLALAVGWEDQLTKRKNAFVQKPLKKTVRTAQSAARCVRRFLSSKTRWLKKDTAVNMPLIFQNSK